MTTEYTQNDTPVVKRPRGRPRKNPLETSTEPKDKKLYQKDEDVVPPTSTKTGKVVGYCPKCHTCVSTLDRQISGVYVCYNCYNEYAEDALLKEKPAKDEYKPKTKKEYLEDVVHVHDDIPMNPPDVISKDELDDLALKPENPIKDD